MTKPKPSPRPLSIKVITIDYLYRFVFQIFTLPISKAVFGFVLSGTPTLCANIFLSLLYLYFSLALWRLNDRTRRFAIGYECYNILNGWAALANPSQRFAIEKVWNQQGLTLSSTTASTFVFVFLAVTIPIIPCVIIWFLIKRKAAFVKPTTPAQASI